MSEAKNSVHPLVRPVWMDWINRRVAKNLDKWGVQDFETLGLAVCEEAAGGEAGRRNARRAEGWVRWVEAVLREGDRKP